MSLEVGSLYVSLNADTKNFARQLAEGLKGVQTFAREVKRASNDIAQIGAAMSSLGGAALSMAAQVDGPTAKAMQGLKHDTTQLAVEVARVLLPAVQQIREVFQAAAHVVAGLSPELRAHISHFGVLAVQIGIGAKALSMFSGVISGLAGMLSAVASGIAAIGLGPIALLVGGVAALAVTVLVLHRAWRQNWGGIQEFTAEALNGMGDSFGAFGKFVKGLWGDFIDMNVKWANSILDLVSTLQKVSGVSIVSESTLEGLRNGIKGLGDDLKSGDFVKVAVQYAKDAGKVMGGALGDEFSRMAGPLAARLKALMSGGKLTAWGPAADRGDFGMGGAVDMKRDAEELAANRNYKWGSDPDASRMRHRLSNGMADMGSVSQGNEIVGARKQLADALSPVMRLKTVMSSVVDGVGTALASAGGVMMDKLGELGSVAKNVIQAAKDGGPMAAIGVALGELMSRTAAFAKLVTTASGVLSQLVAAVAPLANSIMPPLQRIVAVVGNILGTVIGSLGPLFAGIGDVLGSLSPVLVVIGTVLKALTPVIKLMGSILKVFLDALGPVLQLLFYVAKYLGLGIMYVLRGILGIWNGIIDAVADIVRTILNIITLGTQQAWAQTVSDGIRKAKANTSEYDSNIAELSAMTWASANATAADTQATADHAAATDDATQSIREFSEALTNAPSGFKLAFGRYAATSPVGGGTDLVQMMDDRERRRNVQQTGNPAPKKK